MKRALSVAVCLAIVGVAAFIAQHATADDYPGTNAGALYFPDDGPHQGCWVPNPSTATIPDPIWQHLYNYMNTTLATQTGISVSWTTSCTNLADMRLDDRLSDPNYYGLQYCVNVSGNTCLGSNVFINPTTIAQGAAGAGFSAAAVERFNWCHETGHSLGLGHENSCMATGVSISSVYSSHQRTHIDGEF